MDLRTTEIFPYRTSNDWFYNVDLTLYKPVVIICTNNLTFKFSNFCPQSEFRFFVWVSEQTEIFIYTNLIDWCYNIDLTHYIPVVTICTTSLKFNNSTFCPYSEFIFLVWISVQTEIFPYKTLTDWFYNIDLTLYRPVVTICTKNLTFNNSNFCPHSEFVCFV